MSENHLAFIFPAFTSDYTDHPGLQVPGFNACFNNLLEIAARKADPALLEFDFTGKTFLNDELRTQYLTYIYGCASSVALRNLGFSPTINAGYSMGIYASLFDAGSVSFETGLEIISLAYQSLMKAIRNGTYGMVSVIGLTGRDIHHLIDQFNLRVEITNQNAPHSFVMSGFREDILEFMELAKDEGALHTRDLEVSIPYHASFLKEGARNFAEQISHLDIKNPKNQVISLIDQTWLSNQEIIRQEMINNLYYPLNWFRTKQVMMEHAISVFVECGPSRGLTKNSKFVEGDFRFYTLSSFPLDATEDRSR
ncbi:MAG: ACP S-malonyltransferase [Bacteroidales bacterium]